jgi:hypothetical protein
MKSRADPRSQKEAGSGVGEGVIPSPNSYEFTAWNLTAKSERVTEDPMVPEFDSVKEKVSVELSRPG